MKRSRLQKLLSVTLAVAILTALSPPSLGRRPIAAATLAPPFPGTPEDMELDLAVLWGDTPAGDTLPEERTALVPIELEDGPMAFSETVGSLPTADTGQEGAPPVPMVRDGDPDLAEVRRQVLAAAAPDVATAQARDWPRVDVTGPAPLEQIVKAFPNELPPSEGDVRVFQEAADGTERMAGAGAMATQSVSPTLGVAPEYVLFFAVQGGESPATQPLKVRNRGQGTLNYTLEEDLPWLALSATSGSVTDGEDVVTLTVDISGLSAADSSFTGSITARNLDDPTDAEWVWVRLSLSEMAGYTSLYSYDGNGNLQRRVDPNGAIVEYAYDTLGQLTRIDYPDGTSVAYEYDSNGNRTAMTDTWGTTQYVYDAQNRLTAVYFPGLNLVQYAYDMAGRLTRITYPDQRTMRYLYDDDGRMVAAGDGTLTTTYQYAPDTGYLDTQTLPNGITTHYTYDGDGRLTDVVHRDPGDSLLLAFHYTLDANGLRTSVTKETPGGSETTSYTYDDLLRLDGVTYPDGRQVEYAYDPLGNRTAMTVTVGAAITVTAYAYDADNRLLRAGDEVFLYDYSGNMIKRALPERTIEYTYDYENRLVRYDDGEQNVEFVYDGDGNRVAKIVDGVRTNYINDVSGLLTQVLSEADANWYTQRRYAYGLERFGLDEVQGEWLFYLYDSPLRSVAALADSAGALTTSYDYDVFGAPLGDVADGTDAFVYVAEQYDPETSLIYLRSRYYDSTLGRFLSRDPVAGAQSSTQTMNPYQYALNNPVNLIDPGGEAVVVTALGLYMAGVGIFKGVTEAAATYRSYEGTPGRGWHTAAAFLRGFGSGALGALGPPGTGEAINQGVLYGQGYRDITNPEDWGESIWEIGFSATTDWATGKIPVAKGLRPWVKGEGSIIRLGVYQKMIREEVQYGLDKLTDWTLGKIGGDLGGVSLNKTAQLMLEIDDITGATYDPATGQLVFFGQEDVALPEMDLDDLAVAVHSVYGGQDPGVSIDPPLVGGQYSVRYEGQTRETEFGWVMFEADRVMKTLALGRDNLTGQPVTSNVPGYQSMLQRELESGTCTPGETSNRFWFQPKEVRLVKSSDGNSMVFDEVSMEVLTESKFLDNVVGDPEAEAFAAHFTLHYDEFAEEWPVLKDLRRLGKIVAVIKWIKDNDIPMDVSFLDNYDVEYFSTPDNTPSTTVEGTAGTCHITITGGVTYRPPNEYQDDDPGDPLTGGMSDAALDQRPSETEFLWGFQPPQQSLQALAKVQGLRALSPDETFTAVAQSLARTPKDGNFTLAETDLAFPVEGDLILHLTRYYDSFWDKPTGFGRGWAETPYQMRFPRYKQTFTFGADNMELDLYAKLSVVERPQGREDVYTLIGIDDDDLPLYLRDDSSELLRENADGTFTLFKKNHSQIRFDASGRLIAIVDNSGNQIDYAYADELLTTISHASGRQITLAYDGQERVVQAAGPEGRIVTYDYNAGGLLESATDVVAGRTVTYAYDTDGNLVHAVDNRGNVVFDQGFDVYGRATDQTLGSDAPFGFAYDLSDHQTVMTDPYSLQTQQLFDDKFRLLGSTNPLSDTVALAYAGDFGPGVFTDTHGAETYYAYDGHGNVATIVDDQGNRTDLYYDWRDNLVATQDARGIATVFGYDTDGNMTTIYHEATLVFDEGGNLISFYYNPAYTTTLGYDDVGNLALVSDPQHNTRSFSYDPHGMVTAVAETSGLTTGYEYDGLSRLTTISRADTQVALSYDDADNLEVVTTQAGAVQYDYDGNDNLTDITDAEGNPTHFEFDADNNLTGVVDAASRPTDYAYDILGNLTSATLPNDTTLAYEYDEIGRLVRVTSGEGDPLPNITAPSALALGLVQVGEAGQATLLVFNNGSADLVISTMTVDSPAFAVEFAAAATIPAGQDMAFAVTFTPQHLGPSQGVLTIASNDPDQGIATVTLNGTGTQMVTGLSATPGDNGIILTWDTFAYAGGDFHHFSIYRQETPIADTVEGLAPFEQSITDPAVVTFTDTGVEHGHTYYYAITAVSTSGYEDKHVVPAGPVTFFASFDLLGNPFAVIATGHHELKPQVAHNSADDEYLVVFEYDYNGDGSDYDIWGQLLAADGTLIGGPFLVGGYTAHHEYNPQVVYNSVNNEYLVAFEYDYNGDGSDLDLLLQRISATGSQVGVLRQISSSFHDRKPRLAYNSSANQYLLAWEQDYNGDGSNWVAYGWVLAADTTPVGSAFFVGGYTQHERRPVVVYNSTDNEYLAAYEYDYYGDESNYVIYGQRLAANGTKLGSRFFVGGYIYHEFKPEIAYNGANNEYLAVFEYDSDGDGILNVLGQRLSATGDKLSWVLIYSAHHDRKPHVAYNGTGNEYLVVWEHDSAGGDADYDVVGYRLSAALQAIGNANLISRVVGRQEFKPRVVYNHTDNQYLTVWEHDYFGDGSDYDIRGQRLGAENPELRVQPLALDFGDAETALTFSIFNDGTGTLDWIAIPDQLWLTTSPASGATATEEDIVTAMVDRSDLAVGSYAGTIYVFSDGGSGTVAITMNVPNSMPYAPANPSPPDGATNQSGMGADLIVPLSWSGGDPNPGDSVTYDVYWSTDVGLVTSKAPSVLVSAGQSETTYVPGVLDYATAYYWRIVSHDSHGAETDGDVWSFGTIAIPAPGLVPYTPDPTNHARPTLDWNAVSGAAGYHIQVDDDADLSSPLVDDDDVTTTQYTPAFDLPEGTIYWHVSSIDNRGREGAYSTADEFVIDITPPPSPGLIPYGPDPTNEQRPALDWHDVADASVYHVQIDVTDAFAAPIVDGHVAESDFTPSVDLPEGSIYWRVSSQDVAGNESAFSPPDDFVIDVTSPPQITGLQAIRNGDQVVLRWEPYSNPDGDFHHFNVYREEAKIVNVTGLTPIDQSVTDSSVTVFTDTTAVPNTAYYYAVTAVDVVGNEKKAVSSAGVGPILGIAQSGSDVVLSWNDINGAASYRVYRDTEPYFTPSANAMIAHVTTLAYTDADVLGDTDTNHYYVVTAVYADGGESAISNRAGAFDFALVPAAQAGERMYNLIALNVAVPGVSNADSLAGYVGGGVYMVLRYDAPTQSIVWWLPGLAGENFPVEVSEPYFLYLDDTAPSVVSLVGGVPREDAVRFSLIRPELGESCNYNFITVPLHRDDLVDADALAADIGGVYMVIRYNAETQDLTWRMPGVAGENFAVRAGYPYIVCLDETAPPTWP